MTVLANEQVIDGRGWRSGALVERRKLDQWFLRITDFAEELLDGLAALDQWPDKVRLMQENWIGKSRGCGSASGSPSRSAGHEGFEVFTTRPDTIFGASFAALSPDHPIAAGARRRAARDVAAFIAECKKGGTTAAELETAEKKGFDTGLEGRPPARSRLAAAGLHRQFRADGLRHRRHFRLPGARPARPRIRPQIRPAGAPGGRCFARGGGRAGRRRGLQSAPGGWSIQPLPRRDGASRRPRPR